MHIYFYLLCNQCITNLEYTESKEEMDQVFSTLVFQYAVWNLLPLPFLGISRIAPRLLVTLVIRIISLW